MATLPTRSFNRIVSDISAGIQGRVSSFLTFAIGSVFRAIAESYAGVALWLQGLILEVAKLTRLSTSRGPDVDTWIADWGIMTRLAAQPATGLLTFSRFTASGATPEILVGARVKTADNTQSFRVTADTNNTYFNVGLNAYVMPAQVAFIQVPAAAVVPGSAGNVAAGTITQITSTIQGVDTVTNPAAFTNGIDAESDDAVRARFRLAVASLAKATDGAIGFAIASVQSGMQYTIQDCVQYDGTPALGYVTVVIDDGTGEPPDSLWLAADAAVISERAAGIRIGVFKAQIAWADVQVTVSVKPGYFSPTVRAKVVAAINNYVNSVGLGNSLSYFGLSDAMLAVTGVQDIGQYTINGLPGNMLGDPRYTIKARNVVVS
jgi:uncharacterized phage protein gp47/JayE